jgi:hypothetical protein
MPHQGNLREEGKEAEHEGKKKEVEREGKKKLPGHT